MRCITNQNDSRTEQACNAHYIQHPGGGMYTQRKKDRRSFGGKTSFPLKTKQGHVVEGERRSLPDRRLGNIHMELIDVVDHQSSGNITDTLFYSTAKEDY